MKQSDLYAEIEMTFRQILSLTDLMLEVSGCQDTPNIMTIRDLAEAGVEKAVKLK